MGKNPSGVPTGLLRVTFATITPALALHHILDPAQMTHNIQACESSGFPNPHIPGIPARDELCSNLNKDSLPSSSLACGLPSPTFIGNNGRIELSYSVNFFVGDQPIIKREMQGSDEG